MHLFVNARRKKAFEFNFMGLYAIELLLFGLEYAGWLVSALVCVCACFLNFNIWHFKEERNTIHEMGKRISNFKSQ